ncbi:MAG: radical SAM protein [Ferruginibacter sp.]
MDKIVFSHSYFLRFDPKQWSAGQPYAPLGTLYAAAVMRESGYKVSLFDSMFAKTADELIPIIEATRPDFFVLYDDGFNYLTKMCLTNMREAAFKMIGYAKERGCTVLVSGSDSTDRYEMYLDAGADFILMGEAEVTLQELITAITNGRQDFLPVSGIAFRHQNATVKTKRREVIRDLDALPMPAWDIIDMEPYRSMWQQHAGYFSMNMGTTRGCPFKCNWCAKPIYGNRYNVRSPQHVINELLFLKAKYRFDHIWFCDDIFGLKPGWIHEFANLVQEQQLVFDFKIQCRADLLLQEENIKDLARAGCSNIWMGAESGSQKILDAMDKGTTVQQIQDATHLLKKHGIHPSFFIQFGYPGETKEDIALTVRMINNLLPYEVGISVSYPLPGTIFFENVKSQLQQKTNWTDSDEMALMFRNTYQPAFYKQLHVFVHKNHRKHKALEMMRQLIKHPVKLNYRNLRKALSYLYFLPAAFIEKYKLQQLQKPAT